VKGANLCRATCYDKAQMGDYPVVDKEYLFTGCFIETRQNLVYNDYAKNI